MDEIWKQGILIGCCIFAVIYIAKYLGSMIKYHEKQAIDRERSLTERCERQRNLDLDRCDDRYIALAERLREIEERQFKELDQIARTAIEAIREHSAAMKESSGMHQTVRKQHE
jgi:hypothetical protein